MSPADCDSAMAESVSLVASASSWAAVKMSVAGVSGAGLSQRPWYETFGKNEPVITWYLCEADGCYITSVYLNPKRLCFTLSGPCRPSGCAC